MNHLIALSNFIAAVPFTWTHAYTDTDFQTWSTIMNLSSPKKVLVAKKKSIACKVGSPQITHLAT